jgi:adenylate cyclase
MCYLKKKSNNNKNEFREDSEIYTVQIPPFIVNKKAKKSIKKSQIEFVAGEHFGERYQIIKEVGRGSTGRVYMALDKKMNKVVALKLFNPELSEKKWSIIAETVKSEWEQAKDMHPERLSKLYDIGEIGTVKYISMRYIPREGLKRFKSKKVILLYLAVFLFIIASILYFLLLKGDANQPAIAISAKKSIAVLPFKDLSLQKDQEYFCDGMTEAIINKLSQLEELKVISMNSVRHYKDTKKNIKEIGKDLGVETILAGSIQKENGIIRVKAQLTDIRNNADIWSDSYDQKFENVFTIQDKTAEAIANALQVKLLPDTLANYKTREPKNPEAWEYYLKGMYFIDTKYSFTNKEKDFETALHMFKKALEIDPDYALAYWGLAMAYESYFVEKQDTKYLELMLKNCEKAYKINPNLAEAHLGIGWAYFYKDDLDKAFQSFNQALIIDPNSLLTNFHMASFISSIGLNNKAIEYCSKALARDPLFVWNYILLAKFYTNTGNFKKGIVYIKKGLEIEPDNLQLYIGYTKLSIWTKKYDKAENILDKAEKIDPGNPIIKRYRAWIYAAKGEREKALALIEGEESYKYEITSIYSLLGMKDEAIKYIKEGLKIGYKYNWVYVYSCQLLKNNPCYDSLRDDPRFQEILKNEKKKYEEKLLKYSTLS